MMHSICDFRMPTQVVHGTGSAARLPEFLPEAETVLVVSDKGLVDAGVLERVTDVLENAEISWAQFTEVVGNPVARNVTAGARAYARAKCGAIVAVGGGSPMDVAKMIGVLVSHGGRIEQYLGVGGRKIVNDIPPLICLPTTYGTGSEVTPFAVLTNPKSRNKDPVISWKTAPRVGILDPQLSVTLPASVGGPTGMDALTHAIESYTNLLATPMSDSVALAAIELISENLLVACANDYELEATQNMLIASCLAGVAFSQTRLGNVHAMSHPVGAQYGVHHGLANAVLLPWVMEYNLQARLDKFAVIAETLGEDPSNMTDCAAAGLAVERVRQMNDDLGIPDRLRDTGVKVGGIPALVKAAMQSGNVTVNPRKTTLKDMEALFRKAV
ncbi:MAG: iron-containing alcohol dehydrogenase [Candidatus Latescibacterota bacterium]|nr:iron-containing alcohol dehydrogenase [Candidatus Latescibacterota bacterium]